MNMSTHSPIEYGYSSDTEDEGEQKNEHTANHVEPGSRFVEWLQVSVCSDLPETQNSPSKPQHISVKVEERSLGLQVHPSVTLTLT